MLHIITMAGHYDATTLVEGERCCIFIIYRILFLRETSPTCSHCFESDFGSVNCASDN